MKGNYPDPDPELSRIDWPKLAVWVGIPAVFWTSIVAILGWARGWW